MEVSMIALIVMIIITLIGLAAVTYIYIRNKTLDEIREDVYKLFLAAEGMYKESSSGKQKMEYVVSLARSLLPAWAKPFITETLLRKMIQIWFDMIKDLLDDGKYNKSHKEE